MQGIHQHGMGNLLVVFNRNDAMFGSQSMLHYQQAIDNATRMFLHQHGVTGNVGFTFCPIEDQGLDDIVWPWIEFDEGGETGSAETDDSGITDYITQGTGIHALVIGYRFEHRPFIFTICLNHNTGGRQAGRVGNSAFFNRHHFTGGRGVHGNTDIIAGFGNHLPFQHTFSDLDDGLCRFADMLLQR